MKYGKLLILLGFLLSFPTAVKAGVPCSVPFNLTNGTIADASQVMANYNAILTCLSTSAAASGANNDITQLSGLVTPISPAQGGAQALCGANGYKAINDPITPNTQLDVSFNEAIVSTASGAVQRGSNGAVVLNFSTVGVANGLDSGSIGVRTIYYVWLIGNGAQVNSLASLSSTNPTLPTGYNFKCRVSSAVTDDNSHLLPMATLGNRTRTTGEFSATLASFGFLWTNGPITCGSSYPATSMTGLPLTATAWIGSLYIGVGLSGFIATGTNINADFIGTNNSATGTHILALHVEMPLYVPQTIYPCLSNSNVTIDVTGWIDNTNAN